MIVFSNNISNPPQATSANVALTPFVLGASATAPFGTPTITGIDPTLRNPCTQRFNVALEQQLDSATSLTIAYVGSRGRSLVKVVEPNAGPSVPIALKPDTRFSDEVIYTNNGVSRYDSMQVFVQRRFAKGVEATLAYTWAKCFDAGSVDRNFGRTRSLLNLGADPNTAGIHGGGAQFVPLPLRADYGRSDFDIRNYVTVSHVIAIPAGRGHAFLGHADVVTDAALRNWNFSGIGIFRTGEPFDVLLGTDVNDIGDTSTARPRYIGPQLETLYANGTAGCTQYLVPRTTAITQLLVSSSITGPFAALRRNSFTSPSVRIYNISVFRQFHVAEWLNVRFEANALNVFNRVQLAAPSGTLTNALFGQVTSSRAGTTPRQFQFGLKLAF